MDTKTFLFKTLSVLVTFVFFFNAAAYTAPIDRFALRQPSTAVSLVYTGDNVKASSAGEKAEKGIKSSFTHKALTAVLAGVLALSSCISSEYSIKHKLESPEETAIVRKNEEIKKLIRQLGRTWGEYHKPSNLRRLVEIGQPAVPFLIKALNESRDEDIRMYAAKALGEIKDPRAIRPLISALRHSYAAEALVKIGQPVVQPLVEVLKENEWWSMREAAYEVLVKMGSLAGEASHEMQEFAIELAITKLRPDLPKSVVEEAKGNLIEIGQPAVESLIQALIDDKDPRSSFSYVHSAKAYRASAAAKILGEIGDKKAIDPLIKALKYESVWTCKSAYLALNRLGWKPQTKEEKILRIMAARNMIELRTHEMAAKSMEARSRGRIFKPMDEEALFIAAANKDVIDSIDQSGIECLVKFLEHKNKRVRRSALMVLGDMGPKAKKALPALVKLLLTEHGDGSYVLETVRKIGPLKGDKGENVDNLTYIVVSLVNKTAQAIGWFTDADLRNVTGAKGVRNKIFYRPDVLQLLKELDNLYPTHINAKQAFNITDAIARNISTPIRPTFAADEYRHLAFVTRLSELSKVSRIARVMVTVGLNSLPAHYENLSYGVPSYHVTIDLPKWKVGDNDFFKNAIAADLLKERLMNQIPPWVWGNSFIGKCEYKNDRRILKTLIEIGAVHKIIEICDSSPGVLHPNDIAPWYESIECLIASLCIEDSYSSAIPELITALSSENKDTRKFFAKVFGRMGNKAKIAIPTLIRMAKTDETFEVRENVISALGAIRDARAVQPLIECLSDKNLGIRSAAARALGEFKDPRVVEPLIEALSDEYLYVRSVAAEILGKLKDPRAVESLIANLDNPGGFAPYKRQIVSSYEKLRINAARALGEIGPVTDRVIPALVRKLSYGNEGAIEALVKIGAPAVPALIENLHHRDNRFSGHYRYYTVITLGKIGPGAKDAVPTLISTMIPKHGNIIMTDYVNDINILRSIGVSAVPALIEALGAEYYRVRLAAVIALGEMGSVAKDALPKLKKLSAEEKTIFIRKEAKKAVEKISGKHEEELEQVKEAEKAKERKIKILIDGLESWRGLSIHPDYIRDLIEIGEPAVPLLIEALRSRENIITRLEVVEILGEIGNGESVPSLIELLKDKEEDELIRKEIARTLAKIGQPAVQPLIETLKDEKFNVREYAIEALGEIGDERATPKLKELAEKDNNSGVRSAAKRAIERIQQDIKRQKQRLQEEPTMQEGTMLPLVSPFLGFISDLKDKIKPLKYKYTPTAEDSREPKVVVFDQTVLGRSLELSAAIKNAKNQLSKARFYNTLVLLDQPITQEQAQQMLTQLGLNGLFDVVLTYDLICDIYRESYGADTILTYIRLELKQGTIKDENFIILASEDKIESMWRDKIGKVLTMVFKPLEDDNQLQLLSIALAGAIEILANNGQLDPHVQKDLNNKVQQLRQSKFQIIPTKVDNEEYHQRLREYRDIIIQA